MVAPLFLEWLRVARESGWDRSRLVEGASIALVPAGLFVGKPAIPLMGFSRYVLVAFPLFITLAVLLEGRPRARAVYLFVSAAASLVFCAFFVSWRFVA